MIEFHAYDRYRIPTPDNPNGRVYWIHSTQLLPDGTQNVTLGTRKPSFSNDIGYGGTVHSSAIQHAELVSCPH